MTSAANFQSAPEFTVLIARERQQDLLRAARERRLAQSVRKDGRTRSRFLRWR